MRIVISLALLTITILPLHAREIRMQERYNVGGYIRVGPTTPHFFKPHRTPRTLSKATDAEIKARGNREAAETAQAYMTEFPGTTAMLLIDREKIVFEEYQGMGRPASEFYGMSISKSMTSLAIGKALCNGVLQNLETLAGDIVPELKISNYGKSTVRHLLTMSSGAFMTVFGGRPKYSSGMGRRPRNGKPFGGPSWPIRLGQISISDVLWGKIWEKTENKNHAAPGDVFLYRNTEPMVMSKIIERSSKMSLAAYFDKHVWQAVRGAQTGHWETDIEGTTLAMSGFQMSLKDWGRIAIWILSELKKPGCYGDYLRQSTTTQIKTSGIGGTANTPFNGYGFQWWTDHKNTPGFWGKGFAGQELGINPKTDKVLIKFGYRSYPGVASGITDLFREWNKSN